MVVHFGLMAIKFFKSIYKSYENIIRIVMGFLKGKHIAMLIFI